MPPRFANILHAFTTLYPNADVRKAFDARLVDLTTCTNEEERNSKQMWDEATRQWTIAFTEYQEGKFREQQQEAAMFGCLAESVQYVEKEEADTNMYWENRRPGIWRHLYDFDESIRLKLRELEEELITLAECTRTVLNRQDDVETQCKLQECQARFLLPDATGDEINATVNSLLAFTSTVYNTAKKNLVCFVDDGGFKDRRQIIINTYYVMCRVKHVLEELDVLREVKRKLST